MRWAVFGAILAGASAFWLLERDNPVVSVPEPIDRRAADDALTPLLLSGILQWAEADTASVGVSWAFLDASDAQQRGWLDPAYRALGPLTVHTATGERIGTFGERGLTMLPSPSAP